MPNRRAIVVHPDGFRQRSVRGVGLAGSHLKRRAAMAGVAETVHDKARLHPGRMGGGVVYSHALHARPFQRIPYSLGVVGPPVETVDPLSRRNLHPPARNPVRARVRPRRECGPVGRGPHRERGKGLVDGALTQHALEMGQGAFRGESLHHRDDKAVHAESVDFLLHGSSSGKGYGMVGWLRVFPTYGNRVGPIRCCGINRFLAGSRDQGGSGSRSGEIPTGRG